MAMAWCEALWASSGGPITSPQAKIAGMAVCRLAETGMKPLASRTIGTSSGAKIPALLGSAADGQQHLVEFLLPFLVAFFEIRPIFSPRRGLAMAVAV